MKVIYWAPNGFQEGNPHAVDSFSRASLVKAVARCKELRDRGEWAHLLVINSVVRDSSRRIIFRDTLYGEAVEACRRADVSAHVELTPRETTGSPTDGLALAEFMKANPDAIAEVVACTKECARYFGAMYCAVASHVLGYDLQATFSWATSAKPDAESRFVYGAMWLVTIVAAVARPTFMAWYNFLNWRYQRRLDGFSRTIN